VPDVLSPSHTTLILARNDGESVAIIEIAHCFGFDIRVSSQPWGARLEMEPQEAFRDLRETVIIVEMPGPDKEPELSLNHRLIIIDHHKYQDIDRSNPKSALEQFADLIGYSPTRWEMGVALNDRGYIPALEAANYSVDEIRAIREFDLKAQGYSVDDFRKLEVDYRNGSEYASGLFVVVTRHPRTSYLSDLHYLNYAGMHGQPDLLMFSEGEDGLINNASLSGRPDSARRLYQGIGGFCGGDEKISMYWGKEYPEKVEKDKLIAIIEKILK
jgi:hypothetical protein